jgi:hypothetical protein
MSDPDQIWSSFTHDPRRPEHAALRAADRDRDLVHQVLADGYADGRLDREEFETRTDQVAAAKTLGELAPVVEGLVPASSLPVLPTGGAPMSAAELQRRAVAEWRGDRRDALWTFLSASLICWAIWLVTSWGGPGFDPGFAWPVFVSLGTGLNVARLQFQRQAMIDAELRRLEKKQRKRLEQGHEKGPENGPEKDPDE